MVSALLSATRSEAALLAQVVASARAAAKRDKCVGGGRTRVSW